MERGMKKWRPYAALPEYKDYFEQMLLDRTKISKPALSPDQKEEIEERLKTAQPGEGLSVRMFQNGFIYTVDGDFIKADGDSRELILTTGGISFYSILEISEN